MSAPIKMKLQAKNRIPHGGGWHIVDPLTGVRIFAVTWDQLMTKVYEERRAMGVPIGLEIEDEVESWAAAAHPDEAECVDPRMPRQRNLNLDDITRGTRTIVSFMLHGSKTVPKEEAEARAQICLRCPMNQMWLQSCSICDKLDDIVKPFIGSQTTSVQQNLFACTICQCSNKSQVWVPLDILQKSLTDEMRQQFAFAKEAWNCWKG